MKFTYPNVYYFVLIIAHNGFDNRIDRNEIGFLYESFNHECVSDIIIPHITHTNRDYPREKKRMDVTF